MKRNRAGSILGNIIFYALVLALLFIVLGQFGILPFRLMYIQTGSMIPTYQPGDAVMVHMGAVPVQPGDVILFHLPDNTPVVHRIVSMGPEGIVTRGDANDGNDLGKVRAPDGKVLFGIPKIGYLIDGVQSIFRR